MVKLDITYLNQILSDNKKIGIAKIHFLDLKKIVAYTRREDNEEKYYQRAINDKKIESIKLFLLEQMNKKLNPEYNSTALGTFPTSTLISINSNSDYDNQEEFENYVKYTQDIDDKNSEINECFLIRGLSEEKVVALVPEGKSALIVDGQHRLFGITKLYQDVNESDYIIKKFYKKKSNLFEKELSSELVKAELENFEFLCTILIDFDLYDQSRVFADVNFNQKSVNKSLFYDIFGTYPDVDNNEIVLAHEITELFFSSKDSVFNQNIKMLGGGPGLFSQSFFVEALLKHFNVSAIWGSEASDYLIINKKYSTLLVDEIENKDDLEKLLVEKNEIEMKIYSFLNNYFKIIFSHWDDYIPVHEDFAEKDKTTRRFYNKKGNQDRYDHVLLKTIGIGAVMRYVELIFNRTSYGSYDSIKEFLSALLRKIDKEDSNLFSNESKYKGGSGFGTRNRIFYDMFLYTAELLDQKQELNGNELKQLGNIVKNYQDADLLKLIPNLQNKLLTY